MSQAYPRVDQMQSEVGFARDLLVNPSVENLAECREHLEKAVAGLRLVAASGERLDASLRAPVLRLQRDVRQTAVLLQSAANWHEQLFSLLAEPPGSGYTSTGEPPEGTPSSSMSVRG